MMNPYQAPQSGIEIVEVREQAFKAFCADNLWYLYCVIVGSIGMDIFRSYNHMVFTDFFVKPGALLLGVLLWTVVGMFLVRGLSLNCFLTRRRLSLRLLLVIPITLVLCIAYHTAIAGLEDTYFPMLGSVEAVLSFSRSYQVFLSFLLVLFLRSLVKDYSASAPAY